MSATKNVMKRRRLSDDDYMALGANMLQQMTLDKSIGLNALRIGVFLVLDGGFYAGKEFSMENFGQALRLPTSRIPDALSRLEAGGYLEKQTDMGEPFTYSLHIANPPRQT